MEAENDDVAKFIAVIPTAHGLSIIFPKAIIMSLRLD